MSAPRTPPARESGALLARWGRLVHRARWPVLGLSALSLCASLWVIHVGGRLDPPDLPADTESGRARRLLEKELPGQPPSFGLIFSSETRQALDPAFRAEVERALAPLRRDPRVAGVRTAYDPPGPVPASAPLVSRDGRRTLATVELSGTGVGFASLEFSGLPPDLYPSLRGLVRTENLEVVSVGNVALNHDFTEVARKDLGRVEALILPVVAVLLLLVFGSVVAAALPLAVGALAMTGALATTLVLARWVSVSIYAPNIVSMIGLGVAIDYSLFVVSRFREEIRARSPVEALGRTVATAGRAILFSGLTVAIGLLGMLTLGLGNLGSIGWAGTSVATLAVVYGLTTLPALLAVLGRRRRPRRGRARRRPGVSARARAARPGLRVQSLAGRAPTRATRRQLRRSPSLARPRDVSADGRAAAGQAATRARLGAPAHPWRSRRDAGRDHPPASARRRGAGARPRHPAIPSALRRRGAGDGTDRVRSRLHRARDSPRAARDRPGGHRHLRGAVRAPRLRAAPAQGDRDEPALDHRLLRRARVDLPGRPSGEVARLHARADPDAHASHHVLSRLRPVDGLRGPVAEPRARGVRAKRRQRRRRRGGPGTDGPADHRRGRDHGFRVLRLRAGAIGRYPGRRRRDRCRGRRRCDHRSRAACAGHDAPDGTLELVAAGLARSSVVEPYAERGRGPELSPPRARRASAGNFAGRVGYFAPRRGGPPRSIHVCAPRAVARTDPAAARRGSTSRCGPP